MDASCFIWRFLWSVTQKSAAVHHRDFLSTTNCLVSPMATSPSRASMHSNMNTNTSPAAGPRVGKADRKHKVVVIKVGTSSLLRKGHLHLSMLGALAEGCSDLSRAGCRVIVVTSGAVGAGCQVLGAVSRSRGLQTNEYTHLHPPPPHTPPQNRTARAASRVEFLAGAVSEVDTNFSTRVDKNLPKTKTNHSPSLLVYYYPRKSPRI